MASFPRSGVRQSNVTPRAAPLAGGDYRSGAPGGPGDGERHRPRTVPPRCEVVVYGVHLMFGFTLPVQLKTAMVSQPLPLLLMSAGSQPLPVTAYQVGSQ